MQRGFSLVELSIVLVILGLLTGGILAGQSLIRAAELRSVATEYDRYFSATNTFRDKYFALPGDMNNATRFWGDDNAACADPAITNGTPGTCNGNGDGLLGQPGGVSATGEMYQFWKQLALAGLVEGSYTGLAGPGTVGDSVLGSNVPVSKLGNAGWTANTADLAAATADANAFTVNYGNNFLFGADVGTGGTWGPAMKPEEAWNIDTKMDDGRPGYGKIIARQWNNCATGGANKADLANAVYALSSQNVVCAFYMKF
jgi:prepilin-type N-terminal cleavage/methylation domain-containing protein